MGRTVNKLTENTVKHARFDKYGKRTKLADGGGLYLDVQQAGRYWRMKYRFGGKEKLLALGVYPDVPLKQARTRRDEAKRLLAEGIDPITFRNTNRRQRVEAAANTFKTVALEWLEHVHKKSVGESTSGRNERRLEMYAYPKLGRVPVSEIEPPDVLTVLRDIEKTGHLDSAHRVKTLIGQVFRYAVSTGRAKRDVTADLRGILPPPKPKHHAAIVTPEEIAKLLILFDSYWGTPTVYLALKISPYVFLRPGDLRTMRWDEIDWEDAIWAREKTKNGEAFIVPLARQVIELLRQLQQINGRSEWVFPNGHSRKRPMSDNAVNSALKRLEQRDVMTPHGFRAMARTVLAERLGFKTEIIEMQLAHRVRDVHGRAYNRTTWLPERRTMMQSWADYLDDLKKQDENASATYQAPRPETI
ncbi:tyrosine-type recombinase/integrase [Marinobacter sp. F4218]|uniref:tyrosine-type recombinase/integrase n=1 Tax=Marinobacter sp. F4218 TaxID=2862868 RepID=UPI001C625481|nr:integrase arm-type DNA-binding domain-containing protein [Marinobacter sp. F4218]MBW7471148.1 integrase arm-type DNA-binding domain-containing protein [Marinobacter sp. F4218]